MNPILVKDLYVLKRTYEKAYCLSKSPVDIVTSYIKRGIIYPAKVWPIRADREAQYFDATGITWAEYDGIMHYDSVSPLSITDSYVCSQLYDLVESEGETLDKLVTRYARRTIWYENEGVARRLDEQISEAQERAQRDLG